MEVQGLPDPAVEKQGGRAAQAASRAGPTCRFTKRATPAPERGGGEPDMDNARPKNPAAKTGGLEERGEQQPARRSGSRIHGDPASSIRAN